MVFLASDESSFVNGSDFVVDGGMSKVWPMLNLWIQVLTPLGLCHAGKTCYCCPSEPEPLDPCFLFLLYHVTIMKDPSSVFLIVAWDLRPYESK